MDRSDHCDRPHAWQRYLAKVSLPRMGTDSIVERHRRSACAWAGSYAACAEAIHLFPILTIALTASTASGLDLVFAPSEPSSSRTAFSSVPQTVTSPLSRQRGPLGGHDGPPQRVMWRSSMGRKRSASAGG